jgi:hypothetical protein
VLEMAAQDSAVLAAFKRREKFFAIFEQTLSTIW